VHVLVFCSLLNCCQWLSTRRSTNREDYEPVAWRFPETIPPRSPQNRHYCDWSINSLQHATYNINQELEDDQLEGGSANLSKNPLPGHHKFRPKNDQWGFEYYVRQCKKAWRLTYNCNHTSQYSFKSLKKDLNRRRDACVRMIRTFDTIPKRRRVVFIDERAIHRNSRSRSDVFWSRKNPHYFEKMEHKIPYFKICCRMMG